MDFIRLLELKNMGILSRQLCIIFCFSKHRRGSSECFSCPNDGRAPKLSERFWRKGLFLRSSKENSDGTNPSIMQQNAGMQQVIAILMLRAAEKLSEFVHANQHGLPYRCMFLALADNRQIHYIVINSLQLNFALPW